MANAVFDPVTGRFHIQNSGARPPWRPEFKRLLLQNFLETQWAQTTTVAALLELFEPACLNDNGVLEALERRHIVPWEHLTQIYESFMNEHLLFWNPGDPKREHIKIITETILGSQHTARLRQLVQAAAQTPPGKYTARHLIDLIQQGSHLLGPIALTYSDALGPLNSSINNVFIGPARKNRSIGADFDPGSDVPESPVGRPRRTLVLRYFALYQSPQARL